MVAGVTEVIISNKRSRMWSVIAVTVCTQPKGTDSTGKGPDMLTRSYTAMSQGETINIQLIDKKGEFN